MACGAVTVGPVRTRGVSLQLHNRRRPDDRSRQSAAEDRLDGRARLPACWKSRHPSPAFYDAKPVPHGEIRTHWYKSKSLDSVRRLTVYTPPGYDEDTSTRYPVRVSVSRRERRRERVVSAWPGESDPRQSDRRRQDQAVHRRHAVRLRRTAGTAAGRTTPRILARTSSRT